MKLAKLSMLGLFAAMLVTIGGGYARADDDLVKKGEKVFKKCKTCHDAEKEKNKIGPNLVGIIGRKSGSVEGFKYSDAMAGANLEWTEENLDKYLTKPKDFLPKNKMVFPGLKKEKDRQAVIAYLKSLAAGSN